MSVNEDIRMQVLQALQRDNLNGHTYSLTHSIVQGVTQRTRAAYADVVKVIEEDLLGSVVMEGNKIMLADLHEAEETIVNRVNVLIERNKRLL